MAFCSRLRRVVSAAQLSLSIYLPNKAKWSWSISRMKMKLYCLPARDQVGRKNARPQLVPRGNVWLAMATSDGMSGSFRVAVAQSPLTSTTTWTTWGARYQIEVLFPNQRWPKSTSILSSLWTKSNKNRAILSSESCYRHGPRRLHAAWPWSWEYDSSRGSGRSNPTPARPGCTRAQVDDQPSGGWLSNHVNSAMIDF